MRSLRIKIKLKNVLRLGLGLGLALGLELAFVFIIIEEKKLKSGFLYRLDLFLYRLANLRLFEWNRETVSIEFKQNIV